jgi:two-component system LytT family sensor kinase
MNNMKTFYWIAQALGWLVYMIVIILLGFLGGNFSVAVLKAALILWFIGVLVSHGYRCLLVYWGWLSFPIVKVIPLIVLASGVCGITYFLLDGLFLDYFIEEISPLLTNDWKSNIPLILNLWVLFLIWSIIYFSVFYFVNYKRQEIENLKFQAANNEMELNNLKAQLNPHFMFNAMNSIRALVDEDPQQAKKAVTQLSNLLRSTLMLGKKQQVPFSEELTVVKNYLALEQIRYEERLTVSYEIHKGSEECLVPPLLVQTLVENAIKHGISRLTLGGEILIKTTLHKKYWELVVQNTGTFVNEESSGTGIGLNNARHRLKLMYGNKAKLKIDNQDGLVVVQLNIPLSYEN